MVQFSVTQVLPGKQQPLYR